MLCGNLCFAKLDTQKDYLDFAGANIYYETMGSGDPIFVLHGGPGLDHGYLLPQMSELAKDHLLVFYDQRGSGHSVHTPINNEVISVQQFVKDLEALREKLGFDKITLLGHSWGGLLAMNYAIKYPDHVHALILMDSAPADGTGFKDFLTEYYKRTASIKNTLDKIQSSREYLAGDPTTLKKYFRLIFSKYTYNSADASKLSLNFTSKGALSGFKVMDLMYKNYLGTQFSVLPELTKLHIPTLIIYGNYDLVPRRSIDAIKNAIPGSALVVFSNSGHFSYIERPKQTLAAIESFLHSAAQDSHVM